MDCNLSRLLLTLGRADRGADDQAALDGHLSGCAACAAFAQRSVGFDAAVASAMAAVPVPPTLREKLLTGAYARRGEAWRRTTYRYAALAAGVLVAVALTLGGMHRYRPVLDPVALKAETEHEWETRESAVRDWLTRQDLPPEFPAELDFDLRHYVFHGQGELAGRDVPVVVFQVGGEQARVFVVRESRLNTRELRGVDGSVWKVTFVPHPTAAGVTYVVLYTNGLDGFRRRPLGPSA
jgi:hypothetical protein